MCSSSSSLINIITTSTLSLRYYSCMWGWNTHDTVASPVPASCNPRRRGDDDYDWILSNTSTLFFSCIYMLMSFYAKYSLTFSWTMVTARAYIYSTGCTEPLCILGKLCPWVRTDGRQKGHAVTRAGQSKEPATGKTSRRQAFRRTGRTQHMAKRPSGSQSALMRRPVHSQPSRRQVPACRSAGSNPAGEHAFFGNSVCRVRVMRDHATVDGTVLIWSPPPGMALSCW